MKKVLHINSRFIRLRYSFYDYYYFGMLVMAVVSLFYHKVLCVCRVRAVRKFPHTQALIEKFPYFVWERLYARFTHSSVHMRTSLPTCT